MTDQLPSPLQVAKRLFEAAEKDEHAAIRSELQDGAETIRYLVLLLRECSSYISDIKEYEKPPRFLLAVQEALD